MDTNNISALANLTTTTNIVQDVRTILQEARQLTARAINSTINSFVSGAYFVIVFCPVVWLADNMRW